MIRKNHSLNCACIDGIDCPNGIGYCDQIDKLTKKTRCAKIGKVKPIDMDKLDEQIRETNIMYSIAEPSNKTIREATTIQIDSKGNRIPRNQMRTLSLFEEKDTVAAHGGKAINDPQEIASRVEFSQTWKRIESFYGNQKYYRDIARGIEAIYSIIPVARELTISNKFLAIDYAQKRIQSRIDARTEPKKLTVESVRDALENLSTRTKTDTRTLEEIIESIPDYDYGSDDRETYYLFFESAL